MRKSFLLICHLVITICFSQNTIISKKQFTLNEIDSICLKNGRSITSEGKINKEIESKSKKSLAKGTFSYSLYLNHFNEENYIGLSNIEKRKYNFDANSELIKAKYHEIIYYSNSYSETIDGEFYYTNDTLNYVKVNVVRSKDKKEIESEKFNIGISELNETKVFKTTFLFDFKYWILNKNEDILKIYKKK